MPGVLVFNFNLIALNYNAIWLMRFQLYSKTEALNKDLLVTYISLRYRVSIPKIYKYDKIDIANFLTIALCTSDNPYIVASIGLSPRPRFDNEISQISCSI